MKTYGNFIANKWVDAVGGEHIGVRDPSTGKEFARLARGSRDDVDLAVRAARAALAGEWGRLTATERGRILSRISAGVLRNIEILTELEARDVGAHWAPAASAPWYERRTAPDGTEHLFLTHRDGHCVFLRDDSLCAVHAPLLQVSIPLQNRRSSHGVPSTAARQTLEQQSSLARLPSSHSSPTVTTPLPQAVRVQFESQPSPSVRLPSSHCSPPSVAPSPQTDGTVQRPVGSRIAGSVMASTNAPLVAE